MGETLHNDAIYVAVNQNVRESKLTLLWTLRTLPVKKLCLLHVHLPFSLTASSSGLDESEINAIQESELKTSYDSLHKYRDICTNKGVIEEDVDISLISGYDVGEGIVELMYQNNIKKLVMGAAADPHYSRGMSITSRKAEYVSQHAPQCCKMWFICKGKLIETREGSFDHENPSDSFSEFHDSLSVSPKKVIKAELTPEDLPPEDFLCPISMEIMQDPHVAADGHTYEADTIRTWLRRGGQNSPKTGARLANHNLTPNYTLRSVINEWLQQHPKYINP
ncbi:hypothetical protein EUTSA_v10008431mg [Eutrema salsugineum]|uniref:RING-type E3 ubiquitin transferase n=1 Tax=Eutrema salsugineum TaxID=72664 RepID=V4L3D4_EUTSA|nr:U-box domain-containing protein 54 [Eutrema salsugineum]ESQ36797.1 hypothetical protein EUTSA_v10008431mg [Eutrema salsugineum]